MRVAVLMLNLGGPHRLDDVHPFLHNLFSDRETIRFPGGPLGQRLFAWMISRRRAPEVAENYRTIGGGTPLVRWTRAQGEAMKSLVERETGVEILPLPCMRYWHPMTDDALAQARDWGADHIVAFSQYPHFSTTTAGNSLREVRRGAARIGLRTPITEIGSWYAHPGYVDALAECVAEAVDRLPAPARDDALVLYSAHSLPVHVVEQGDPYPDHVRATVAAVHRAVATPLRHEIAWQSKVGRMRWLEPATADRVAALPTGSHVVIVPVSFTSDHIETLHEIDIELRAIADRAGLASFVRAPALNARPAFVRALADILSEHLRNHLPETLRSAS